MNYKIITTLGQELQRPNYCLQPGEQEVTQTQLVAMRSDSVFTQFEASGVVTVTEIKEGQAPTPLEKAQAKTQELTEKNQELEKNAQAAQTDLNELQSKLEFKIQDLEYKEKELTGIKQTQSKFNELKNKYIEELKIEKTDHETTKNKLGLLSHGILTFLDKDPTDQDQKKMDELIKELEKGPKKSAFAKLFWSPKK